MRYPRMVAICVLLTAALGRADTIDMIGVQHIADGTSPVFPSDLAAGAGDPAPFNGVIFGSDPRGTFGQFTYTHDFVLDGTPTAATLTLGIIDHDSPTAAHDMIDIFFDGVQQDDTAFRGISGVPSSFSVVTIPVDVALLLDGSLTVFVIATQAADGGTGNSIAGDFSTLSITTTGTSNPVPEPSTLALLCLGAGAMMLVRRRRN